jgi:hypothetical protein
MQNNLELRMYGLVNYQLTGIQKGIQFGHAVVEYANKYFNTNLYQDWAKNWKTFIILNGGTTNKRINNTGMPFGTLNNHLIDLSYNDIDVAFFEESDLGDQLTAIVFIVDERVFNKNKYPDFKKYAQLNFEFDQEEYFDYYDWLSSDNEYKISVAKQWKDLLGGDKNVFLRNFVFKFNLA